MMKPILFTALTILLLTSACVRPASTEQPFIGQNPFTPEAAAHTCAAANLQTSSSTHAEDGIVTFGITLINQSEDPCNLPPEPKVSLLEGGTALDLQLISAGSSSDSVNIPPGESVILILLWQSYCGKAPKSNLMLHLSIKDNENLDVALDPSIIPNCADSNTPSTLTVNPYSYPP